MATIVLADDHALIRRGFRDCIALMEGTPEVVETDSFDATVTVLEQGVAVDLVILDLYMPGTDGLRGLEMLRRRWPAIPTAIMSGSIARDDIMSALARGAAGFIPKTLGISEIQGAIHLMLSGGRYLPPPLLDWVSAPSPTAAAQPAVPAVTNLTRREAEVWGLLKDGASNKEIGRSLSLQEVTVKLHVRSLLRKLGVSNRTQAAALFLRASTDGARVLQAGRLSK